MFGWNRVRLGSHECSFHLLLDDSHVSVPAALPNLRALRRGGTGTLAHWHTQAGTPAPWTTIPSRGPGQYDTVQLCEVHTVQDSASFPGLPITGHRTGKRKTKTALHGFRPRGWAVGVPARSISILQYSIRKSIFEGE